MRISFIITTYNVAPYIGKCLDSLVPCLLPGDQVILIDDCSTDQTDVMVEKRFAAGFGPDVATRLVLLGTNTMGGVGIPANIGLSFADREAVFFVDGDDWLEPGGFLACRAAFTAGRPDILIGNYLEYNETTGRAAPPSDMGRWSDLARGGPQSVRDVALAMIAVPWRKFYARAFLGDDIRFPEGDFFYEDNPFHWQVCRAAKSVQFLDRVLCHHRTNRPGQTMAATGAEFLAFFDHFDAIRSSFGPDDGDLSCAALEWLVNNMSWHIGRMTNGSYWAYGARAVRALEGQGDTWAMIRHRYAGSAIGGMVEALVRGQVAGTVAAWMAERTQQNVVRMEGRLRSDLAANSGALPRSGTDPDGAAQANLLTDQVNALVLIEEFRALLALNGGGASEQNR